MNYDPTLYLGAAAHYAKARPPYSDELVPALSDELGLDSTGRFLDVGCGPGILCLALAAKFGEAIGLDPDAEMLAEAARIADQRGITNARWVNAAAADIPQLGLGMFQLVTFAQSFHWTDRPKVAEMIYEMLSPGGALAIISHTSTDRPAPEGPDLPRIPLDAINGLIARYLGPDRRAGKGVRNHAPETHQSVLAASRFGTPQRLVLPGREDLVRTPDDILAGLYSTSFAAPHLFGATLAAFEEDLRSILAAHSPEGRFWEWPGDTEVILARKSSDG